MPVARWQPPSCSPLTGLRPPILTASHADHDHDDKNADAEGHADYEARVRYDCRDVAALAFVDLWLLQRLPGVQQADVNIVSASLQTATKATPASTRIELR
ncbi:MAG: DUF2796 domain-containing protein [Proteobacteria bacterium]|nr:DUF2796 domain-containing protein [Pseudomonadota bacterium]